MAEVPEITMNDFPKGLITQYHLSRGNMSFEIGVFNCDCNEPVLLISVSWEILGHKLTWWPAARLRRWTLEGPSGYKELKGVISFIKAKEWALSCMGNN
jgi:hypothetical protein